MLRVWSCILGCLGFLLDGWPILPMFFCLLCVVSSYLTMKNSNMEAEAMKIRISTGRGAAAMHALLSATKKKAALPDAFRCRRANPDCWVLPVSFDRSMWQNGRHNGTTVLTCEANRMQKRSDQSLPYPAGPRQAVPCPKNSGFWPAKLRFVYWQRCFFTSKHSDLPGENSGFWRQTWKDFFLFASNYWDATLLHYSCNQNFGTLSAKKRWLLHSGFASFRWHRNEFYQQKSNFNQQKRRLHTQGWWMVMCFSVCHVDRKVDYCNWQLKHKVMCRLLEIYEIGYVGGVLRDRNLCQTPDW